MTDFKKDESEIGCLWEKTGGKGPYMTGLVNGVAVVVFKNTKRSEKSPDWRVLKAKPREPRERDETTDNEVGFPRGDMEPW